jgi:hypothetical protein
MLLPFILSSVRFGMRCGSDVRISSIQEIPHVVLVACEVHPRKTHI